MQIDKRTRTELKQYFVKNAIPTESNFGELIDGMLSQRDDGIAKLPNDALSIEAAGDATSQKKAIHFYTSFGDTDPTWVLSLNPRLIPANAATAKPGFSIGDGAGNSRLFIERTTGRIGIGTLEPKKKLHIQGATSGPFMNDAADRPGIVVTGHYPEIALFSNVDNGSHGPAIRLGSYTDGTASTFKHWVIGTAGRNASFLDIGFSDKSDPNPHAGIRNHHNGKTILTLAEDGSVEVTGTAILGYENTIRDYNAALKSGFYQNGGTAATGDIPDTSHGWTHLFVQRHSNPTNNHQLQIASGYHENDRIFFRKIARGLADPNRPAWNELATRDNNTFTGTQVVKGAIVPSPGNSAAKGIQFPSNPGGGGGDEAFIRYYPVTGEACKLMIGILNDSDDTIGFAQGGVERMTVKWGGLDVNGWISGGETTTGWVLGRGAWGPDNWLRITTVPGGNVYHDLAINSLWSAGAKRFDLAEVTQVYADDRLEQGDIVVIDREQGTRVRRSMRPYDPAVYGIVSSYEQAAFVIGGFGGPEQMMQAKDKLPIALVGRVKVKVCTENGPIRVGDLLTSSSTPGHAMRCPDPAAHPGAIAGKALEPLASGTGTITALVTLQ